MANTRPPDDLDNLDDFDYEGEAADAEADRWERDYWARGEY